jgi:hypothetical protein
MNYNNSIRQSTKGPLYDIVKATLQKCLEKCKDKPSLARKLQYAIEDLDDEFHTPHETRKSK